jgi:hypothetical protein
MPPGYIDWIADRQARIRCKTHSPLFAAGGAAMEFELSVNGASYSEAVDAFKEPLIKAQKRYPARPN